MAFVTKRDDVVHNIKAIENFLKSKKADEKEFAIDQILNSENVVIYKVNGENHFAPARFLATKKNTIAAHNKSLSEIEEKEVANVMGKIVGAPFHNGMTEEKYLEYVKGIAKDIPAVDRKFYRVKDERGKNLDLKL